MTSTESTESTKNTKSTKSTSSSFRKTSKKFFITIPTHLGKEYIDFIDSLYPIEKWIYCNEKADEEAPYEHSHAAIEFKRKVDIKNARVFDFNGLHPNIETVRNWNNSVKYCMKEGTYDSNFDLSSFQSFACKINSIMECNTPLEAVQKCAKGFNEIMPIIQLHKLGGMEYDKELLDELLNATFDHAWQQSMHDALMVEADSRIIYWVYDESGNTGKTRFCDIMEARYLNRCLVMSSAGRASDIFDVIRNWMASGNRPEITLFDLPRTFEDRDSIYTILESIKNGRLTCTKYSGRTLRFRRPHVCVFANWLPQIEKVSLDRWRIFSLHDGSLSPVTLRRQDSDNKA